MTEPDRNVVWPVLHPDGHIVHASTPHQAMDLERRRLVNWPPPVEGYGLSDHQEGEE